MSQKWEIPPELVPYVRYTNYPTRAERLINSLARWDTHPAEAAMRAEARAQFTLLARLHEAGLLKENMA